MRLHLIYSSICFPKSGIRIVSSLLVSRRQTSVAPKSVYVRAYNVAFTFGKDGPMRIQFIRISHFSNRYEVLKKRKRKKEKKKDYEVTSSKCMPAYLERYDYTYGNQPYDICPIPFHTIGSYYVSTLLQLKKKGKCQKLHKEQV